MPTLRLRDDVELGEWEFVVLVYDKERYRGNLEKSNNEYEDMLNQVYQVCKSCYGEIINKQLVKVMVENVKELYPGIIEDLIPEKLSYYQVLQRLRKEIECNQNLRNLIQILEDMEDAVQIP